MPRRTVAVIGAGAAGLAAARELLRVGLHVAVFEKSGRTGGTWAYDPRADDADPLSRDPAAAGAVHGSLYASLRTNLPRELMGFSDFPMAGRVFAGDARAFPGHREVLAFLDAFAEEHGVLAHVRLRTEVLRVRPEQGERWVVAFRGEDGEVAEEVFDAVVVCNGHWTVPFVPKIQGIGNWSGKQMHSHNYRTPEPFQNQIVVTVGMGASGIDIALDISHVAKEVHIASRYSEDRLGKFNLYQNVWIHKEIECIQDDGKVRFAEGSAVPADVILYCTGYHYYFPFIDLDGLTVDDNRVGPLYKNVFPPKYAPNLSFVGLTTKTIIFPSLELESKWVAAVLSGKATLPSQEDMMASVLEHYRRMEEAGRPKRHTHVIMPEWEEHMNWLADQVGEPHLEARRLELLVKALCGTWSLDEGYRDHCEQDDDRDTTALKGLFGLV
ncbi:hypothetical protein HU200_018644 [Digitaria exilis]|uniref:Flavin-containing monooxygenase n=1 Tax=Digitaria exilis TaxID=1010633 RepID=A0A835KE92_9POAL|nr:hypothetical protein HU200_018644 [Digitaria exilis]